MRQNVYYESIKRRLKIRPIYECRYDERLQTKTKEFTPILHVHIHWVGRGTGTPKVVRISSHRTVDLTGPPLEQGGSLIFFGLVIKTHERGTRLSAIERTCHRFSLGFPVPRPTQCM